MTRTLLIALFAAAALAVSACGEDEVAANGEQAAGGDRRPSARVGRQGLEDLREGLESGS